MGCPSHEEINGILHEDEGSSRFRDFMAHLDACKYCQLALAELSELPMDLDTGDIFGPGRGKGKVDDFEKPAGSFSVMPQEKLNQLSHLVFETKIGEGGMAEVYKCYDERLGRNVAVKVIDACVLSTRNLERLEQEARIHARLNHPNVVSLLEFKIANGMPYLIMELVEGGTLKELFKSHSIKPRKLAEILRDVSLAVQAAHELGIMHRDLKPANILLEKPRRSGMPETSGKSLGMSLVPKVSDFGLAKLSEAESDLSKSAIYLGTPAYMSPEQTLGDSERIDRRADIYSLGVILYEGLTGRLPFVGEDLNDLFSRIRHHAAVPPSAIQAGVPHDLETICLKCLEKDPRARYQTAAQLAEELTCFLEGNPIKARPIGPVGQSFRWAKRKPVLALALILLFVELVAFAAWSRRSAKMGWDERETIKKEADRLRADYVKLRDHYTYGIDLIHDNSSELNRIIERGSNDRELRMFQMKLTRQRGDLAERVISDLIVQDVFGNFLVEAYYLAAIKDMMDRDYDKAIMQYRSAVDRALELSETGKLADKSRYFAMRSVVGLADFAIESDDYIEAVRLLEQSWERFASHGEDYVLAKPVKMMSMQTSFRLIQCYEMLGRPDHVREQQLAIDKLVNIPVLEGEEDVDLLY